MRIGSLFSGYGGLDLGVQAVLGGTVAWHCEVDKDANRILEARFPGVPNHGDITSVDWAAVEPVDVLTGGFPCQDLSHAGRRLGLAPGTRSGLWTHMADAVDALRPALVVVENVRGLLSARTDESVPVVRVGPRGGRSVGHTNRALGRVLSDLADIGYDAAWCGLRAADVGAPHGRFRVFLVAWLADAEDHGRERFRSLAGADGWGRPADNREPAADAAQHRRGEGWAEPARLVGGPDVAEHRAPAADAEADGWGPYAGAVHRWEHVLGRPAPAPTEPGRSGPRLAPRFVEWMMGLPAGWVCDVPISRNAQLKALGNGVVPQQAEAALRRLLETIRLEEGSNTP